MNDELERLRDVIRALVVEHRANTDWSEAMSLRREMEPTKESIRQMRRLFGILKDCKKTTDGALARLAEVNPELVSG